jgi:hypothetical protein
MPPLLSHASAGVALLSYQHWVWRHFVARVSETAYDQG